VQPADGQPVPTRKEKELKKVLEKIHLERMFGLSQQKSESLRRRSMSFSHCKLFTCGFPIGGFSRAKLFSLVALYNWWFCHWLLKKNLTLVALPLLVAQFFLTLVVLPLVAQLATLI
jgi:hypothetical protein